MGALDRLRTPFRWKADDLDAAALQLRIGASSLTLGGLLKHLAFAEDFLFTTKLTGAPLGPPSGRGPGSTPPWPTADSTNLSMPAAGMAGQSRLTSTIF